MAGLDTTNPAPRWLWKICWLMLASVLIVSIGAVLALSAGLADPPRAGVLVWSESNPVSWPLFPGDGRSRVLPLISANGAYTLEVTARFSAAGNVISDPAAFWEVIVPSDSFRVFNNGYYQIESQHTRLEFIHLKPGDLSNKLSLDVTASGSATLRLNDEIAWQGVLPVARPITLWASSDASPMLITWQRIALYAPSTYPRVP